MAVRGTENRIDALMEAQDPADAGARVLAVGSVPMDLVLAAIRPWVNADNESGFRSLAPWVMSSAELLHAAGVVDDLEHPGFVLRRRDGTVVTIDATMHTLAEIDAGAVQMTSGFVRTEAMERREEPVWWRVDEPSRTFILAYNAPGEDTKQAVAAMTEAQDTGVADRVVVDLRYAPGGAYHPSLPMVAALAAEARIDHPDRLAVLVGRDSASATTALVSRIEQDTGATLIGEPTPARPNTFLDPVWVTLPISGLTFYMPSSVAMIAGPEDVRDAVYPDIRVQLLGADVLSGRDRALEVALAPR